MSKGINPHIKRNRRTDRSAADYLSRLTTDDRFVLSEVLTIIESHNSTRQALAQEILAATDQKKNTIRIGITGSPGAGKSTLIEQIGLAYLEQGKSVAVLAVDPSSTKSEGSILGDKTRMPLLSNHPQAYVRPTATASHLGGVSKTTSESIAICEHAGYDVIIIESVGVGQSEIELSNLVDIYALVLLPGGGDDIQGIKRGVVEMADLLIVNKADGDRLPLAKTSKKDFESSIGLFEHDMKGWKPPVLVSSALESVGIEKIITTFEKFVNQGKENGYFSTRRANQKNIYIKNQVSRHTETIIEQRYPLSERIAQSMKSDEKTSVFDITHQILKDIDKKLNL